VDAMSVLGTRPLVSMRKICQLRDVFIQECVAVEASSIAARRFFGNLHLLIRINALLNNSKKSLANAVRRSWLLRKYSRELDTDPVRPAQANGNRDQSRT
ncbi:MAG: hypothetical protein OEM25_07805, partial [Gammaproteobacteria bacterium]|nr:hypothetical protein [Gammaproteobacteria bacterium]